MADVIAHVRVTEICNPRAYTPSGSLPADRQNLVPPNAFDSTYLYRPVRLEVVELLKATDGVADEILSLGHVDAYAGVAIEQLWLPTFEADTEGVIFLGFHDTQTDTLDRPWLDAATLQRISGDREMLAGYPLRWQVFEGDLAVSRGAYWDEEVPIDELLYRIRPLESTPPEP